MYCIEASRIAVPQGNVPQKNGNDCTLEQPEQMSQYGAKYNIIGRSY